MLVREVLEGMLLPQLKNHSMVFPLHHYHYIRTNRHLSTIEDG